jgi:hypothetical protein
MRLDGNEVRELMQRLSGFPANVLAFACRGRVTKKDYETVFTPAVDAVAKEHHAIRLYYEIGRGFAGFEPGALWQDFRVGLEHLWRWDRIAIVTDLDWIRYTVEALRFLLPGHVRVYTTAETAAAREWAVGT